MRYASARRFAPASAVQVHVLVSGEYFCFGVEIVGLNSNRAGNADSACTVITMAAHIKQQYLSRAFGLELRRQRRDLYSRYNAIGAVLPVQRNAITEKCNHGNDDYNLDRMSCCTKSMDDLRHEIAEHKSDRTIRESIGAGAQEIQSQELKERHFHASSQRRGHRARTGNELGDQQGGPAALIERFRRAQNACFLIDGNPAEKFQQRPSHMAAKNVKQ